MSLSPSPSVSSIKDPIRKAFMAFIEPVTLAEWKNTSKSLKVERFTYILNNEEVTVRLEYIEDGQEMKVELLSLEHGVFGGLFKHTNLPVVLSEIKGGIVHFEEGNHNKVIMGVGPHGMLPIELLRYSAPSIENKTETLEEEVRRLRYHLFELVDSYNELKIKYDDLEAKLGKLSSNQPETVVNGGDPPQ